MSLPENYSYSDDHEWINTTADKAVGAKVKVGITSVATDRLGEIVFADLPQVGDSVEALDDCAIINGDPFTAGWLFEVEVTEVGPLLTAAEYAEKNGI